MRSANVKGTDIVLGVAHELGIENNVYVSSIVALGDTGKQLRDETYERQAACVSAYEQSKTDAHAVALNYIKLGLPLVIVLPGTVIGVNDHSPWGYFARLYVNRIMPPISWAREAIFTHAHVEDTAEGIALAAEKGRPGEMYLLAGERITMGEAMAMWCETPGGSRFRLWVPIWLASLMFWPLEPLQRWVGLPAFISRETATGARIDYCFSSEKAKRELGWAPRPARQGWMETMQAERQLQARRNGGGLVSRLNPLDDLHLHGWHAAHSQQAPPEQAV